MTAIEITSIILLGIAVSGVYAWQSSFIVLMLFGAEYSDAAQYAPFTVVAVCGYCVAKVLEAYMISYGQFRLIIISEVAVIVSIVLGLAVVRDGFIAYLWIVVSVSVAVAIVRLLRFVRIARWSA
ncbi:hypothetical protein ACXN5S_16275 [Pseudoroseicyclus sp. H15]